jgi:hypothetical protein
MTNPDAILARLRQRRLSTVYVSEYFLPFRMTPERMRDLDEQIRPLPSTPLNRDFTPVAYYYDNILWHSLVATGARSWLRSLAEFPFALLFVTLALLLVVVAALPRPGSRPPVALAVASMGCVMMGLEVLLLLAFQAIHGYVYHQLALVIAGFMAGMAVASRSALRGSGGWSALITVQGLGAAAPLVLYAAFLALGRAGNDALSQILFPGLAFASGALGGYQFPVASRIFHAASKKDSRGFGALYSLDLAGSCIAALFLSAWVIPVYGFLRTVLLLSLVNAVPAALLWLRSPARPSIGGHHLPV